MVEKVPEGFEDLKYQDGYMNHFATEALPGALPIGQNTPQKVKYGLYAEQLNGTAFTLPREKNLRSWLYRCLPSVTHQPYVEIDKKDNYSYILNDFMNSKEVKITPNQLRWSPIPFPKDDKKINFIEGLVTVCGAGHPSLKEGIAIYLYSANTSMNNKAFYSSDGDFLIVPQTGKLFIQTEFGKLVVEPLEICIIPRGIRFSVNVSGAVRGWVAEIFKGHLVIPSLGPIGANGLANPRDFQVPVASYEKVEGKFTVINKYQGEMFESEQNHSCYDVVAWHGNYYPCKYNLRYFNAMNSVTFDHPDPSIFTVITCQSDEPGTAILDFVIFPPRWMVAEHTFRPPYYHRNTMSEFMGNIIGSYDAKETGFGPGCSSLHSGMTPHGPESDVFEKASEMELKPVRYPDTSLSFMFESCLMLRTTTFVMDNVVKLDQDYYLCWQKLKNNFKVE